MESVIFFNGMGSERETWETHAGGHLTPRFTEGGSPTLNVHSAHAFLTCQCSKAVFKVAALSGFQYDANLQIDAGLDGQTECMGKEVCH